MNPSDCHDALSALLDEWLNPSLDAARRQEVQREVERIIAVYPEGEREWRGLQALGATMRAMPTASVPPSVRSNINAALHAQVTPKHRFWSFGSLAWLGSASVAAFVLWIIAGPANLNINPQQYRNEAESQNAATSESEPESAMPPQAEKPSAGAKQSKAGTLSQTSKQAQKTEKAAPPQAAPPQAPFALPPRTQKRASGTQGQLSVQRELPSQRDETQKAILNQSQRRAATAGSADTSASKPTEAKPNLSTPKAVPPPAAMSSEAFPGPMGKRSKASSNAASDSTLAASGLSKMASPAPKKIVPGRAAIKFRSALPDSNSEPTDAGKDLKADWARSDVSFTVVALPVNRSAIVPPPLVAESPNKTPESPDALKGAPALPAPAAPVAPAPARLPDGVRGRSIMPQPAPGFAPDVRAGAANGGAGVGNGGFGANPAARLAPPRAPQPQAPGDNAVSPLGARPAPSIITPRNDDREGAKASDNTFLAPQPNNRRFRVTIQAPRFLGRARARLEGPAKAPPAPVWEGTLEADKPLTLDIDALVAPGERLNLILEQIRPNGESGEHKTFPLVRQ